ncbi:MAG: hypothetical protein AAGF93_08625 [Cyanobacteria bacterium P01_H01_bin.105]
MYEFKQVQSAGTDLNDELLKIWVARYLPDLGSISSYVRHHVEERLRLAIADESRQATAKYLKSYLESDCTFANRDTQRLLLATGLSADIGELKNLSHQVYKLYETLIDCYEQSFIFSPIIEYLHTIDTEAGRLQAVELVIPEFEALMLAISPFLRELKAIYFSSINQHLIGFMTTHMHFTQQRILGHLSCDEIIWLAPYLQLLDELIAMPWQRICSIASTTSDRPESVDLVKKMIPKVNAISAFTYQKALRTYSTHTSRQGRIQSKAVQRSSMRDLSMFQAYIWLSFLEDSTAIIEQKLLPTCLQVFPLTNVRWELVIFAIQAITETIQKQLTPSERALFDTHLEKIQALFLNAHPKKRTASLLKEQLQQANLLKNISYTWPPRENAD